MNRSLSRVALAATLALGASGCATFRSLFPSRDDVFKPVETRLGEARVVGRDTLWTLEGTGYSLVTRQRALLPDARAALERSAQTYRRYFRDAPTTLRVALVSRDPFARRRAERPDSVLFAGRPVVLVALVSERRGQRSEYGGAMQEEPVQLNTEAIVRGWIRARFAASGDTVVVPTDPQRARTAWTNDPLMPDWIEIGLPELVAGSPRADFLIARLAAQTDSVRPLAAFFAAGRPADGGDTLRGREERADDSRDPYGGMAGMGRAGARTSGPAGRVGRGRGARVLSGAELFDAQAIAVARFLLQRERAEFLGSAADALATGVRIDELLARTEAPVTVAALEPEWRAWLSRQRVDDRLRGR